VTASRDAAVRPVLDWAREQGCEVTFAHGSKHWRVTYCGRFVGSVPSTPSDRRSTLNAKSFIRRNLARLAADESAAEEVST